MIRGVEIDSHTPDSSRAARSRFRQQVQRLQVERSRLEDEMLALARETLVAGSLIVKYKRCNKGGCRCTRGEPHGPFWYVSQTVSGRTVMHFLRAAWVGRVRAACARAKRWRQRRAALVRLQARLLGLMDRLAAEATVPLARLERKR
jgi:hypothetical protein